VGAGTCQLGCRIEAKSSIDVTYVLRAEATGLVEIRPMSMARELTLTEDGRARGVVYLDADGLEHEERARAVVLAANAIETPRLLLVSQSSHFPNGLANSSGLVGKYFMEHLAVFSRGVFVERVDPWRGPPSKAILQDFYETSRENSFARGWSLATQGSGQWPLSVARQVGGWGTPHKLRMQEVFGRTMGLCSVGEQIPDIRNQVCLDPFRKDSFGLPIPCITNRLGSNDRAMLPRINASLVSILQAAGATEIAVDEFVSGQSSHYLGTCRMGNDPRSSVVNSWCRTHDVPNLFIGDGSVFVTGGAANPALTISALAARTASGVIEGFRSGVL
jgi:choline dehydrogenase-like flavoprotein